VTAERKLRVLIVHNAYQQRGGEDMVVAAESTLLQQHGHEVIRLARHNDELAEMPVAAATIQTVWSTKTVRDLSAIVQRTRPDIVHVHNTFPLISPSVYASAQRLGLPVVQTLHNFRLLCPQAMFLRNGRVCEDCLGKLPWRAVSHGCYRQSRLQSAAMVSMLTVHRALGTYSRAISRYIALNRSAGPIPNTRSWRASRSR